MSKMTALWDAAASAVVVSNMRTAKPKGKMIYKATFRNSYDYYRYLFTGEKM